ncbi:MAG TPA: virion core protein (lumpy skin disease virus) [Clostridiales bacterium]|nr:virion core protein (lumpy skin disease virus) [Clostridiales bacterium]
MGLIKAVIGAAGGTLADQWKEFFYCESMPKETLMVRGRKQITGRSSNVKGNENIISNGSGIAVADGQCMIIVEQGKVVEVCSEPGEYTYDTSSEPSIFTGNLGEGIKNTFKTIGKRFTYGGDTGKDQRVYYFNTKELIDNKFGTPSPIPFRVVDRNIGLDIDVSVRCSGVYSYKIVDPILFYTNVTGNVEREYTRDEIDSQLKTEFISALQPAFAKISELGIRPSALPGHAEDLAGAMNTALTSKWLVLRGIQVISIGLNPITLPEEDAELIKQAQRTAILRDTTMAAATLAGAQADAMKAAASNEGGAMQGFFGMGMAHQAGGINAQELYNMGKQNAQQQSSTSHSSSDEWQCKCGAKNTGKFCQECGNPKPAPSGQWTCNCGTVNTGKFCQECGNQRPGNAAYKCNKCGWEPEDPTAPPKFCPECGDIFDDKDKK